MADDLRRVGNAIKAIGGNVNEALKKQLEAASIQLRLDAIEKLSSIAALDKGYISAAIKIKQLQVDGNDLIGGIYGDKNRTSLASYPHKQMFGPAKSGGVKRHGVSGEVIRGRQYQARRFFILPFGNGRKGIAVRTGQGRNAYKVLHSLSVNQLLTKTADEILEAIEKQLLDAGASIVVEGFNP